MSLLVVAPDLVLISTSRTASAGGGSRRLWGAVHLWEGAELGGCEGKGGTGTGTGTGGDGGGRGGRTAAAAVRQLRCEILEAGARLSFDVDDNALLVVGDLEDNVLRRRAAQGSGRWRAA